MWPFCCSESFWSQAGQYRPVDVGCEWQNTSFLLYLTCYVIEHKHSSAAFITKCCVKSVDLLTWYWDNFLCFILFGNFLFLKSWQTRMSCSGCYMFFAWSAQNVEAVCIHLSIHVTSSELFNRFCYASVQWSLSRTFILDHTIKVKIKHY